MYVPTVPRGCGTSANPRLVRKLLSAGATSQWSAKPLSPARRIEKLELERSIRSGVIHRTESGDYWVDEERWAECRTKQMRIVGIAVAASLLLIAILYVLGELS